jgi:hypothetical protein
MLIKVTISSCKGKIRGEFVTLSKKGLRKINVNHENYSWKVSPNRGYVVLVVEHSSKKGRRVEVKIKTDLNDYWVELPNVDELDLKVVTPKDVSLIINAALGHGWDPSEKGNPMSFILGENILTPIH